MRAANELSVGRRWALLLEWRLLTSARAFLSRSRAPLVASDLHRRRHGEHVRGLQTNTAEPHRSPLVRFAYFRAFLAAHRVYVCRKTPWKLSRTRKANVRARLKRVDSVIEAVRASGVECAALVRAQCTVPPIVSDTLALP